jgi:MFS family permease
LFALDNTIVADVQPAIVEEFQAVDKIAWLAAAFFLSGTALMLPFGQFYQVFNAKWFYIFGVVVFEIGSAVCGSAPNINALIVGRAIAGIGATSIYTGSLFLLSVNTSEQERCVPQLRISLTYIDHLILASLELCGDWEPSLVQ